MRYSNLRWGRKGNEFNFLSSVFVATKFLTPFMRISYEKLKLPRDIEMKIQENLVWGIFSQ